MHYLKGLKSKLVKGSSLGSEFICVAIKAGDDCKSERLKMSHQQTLQLQGEIVIAVLGWMKKKKRTSTISKSVTCESLDL